MLIIVSINYSQTHGQLSQQNVTAFPKKYWMQYVSPEEVGYSIEKLAKAKKLFEQSDASSLMVIKNGRVLVSWGNTTRRFRVASMRKSFLNAAYGIYVDKGKIKLNQTLEELEIDDIQGLTKKEKQAKVSDLLVSKSGIYHPAAYSPRWMEKNLPERGSHKPGSFWFYNNWDFNALATVLKIKTKKDVFESFKKEIANPLQMEDFRIWDTFYRFERSKSRHPAYLFKMTARDMARFGLLYLNKGKWRRKQIISENWIKESTTPYAKKLKNFEEKVGYGYLWWTSNQLENQPMYFARGSGGQRVFVLPKVGLVVVHLVNTYENNSVGQTKIINLLRLILDARVLSPKRNPKLQKYTPQIKRKASVKKINREILKKYQSEYRHTFLGNLKIKANGKSLFVETGIGRFKLFPITENQFFPEDIEIPIFFEKANKIEDKYRAVSVLNENRKHQRIIFYY